MDHLLRHGHHSGLNYFLLWHDLLGHRGSRRL